MKAKFCLLHLKQKKKEKIIAFLRIVTQTPEYILLDKNVRLKELSDNPDLLQFINRKFVVYKVSAGVRGKCDASEDHSDINYVNSQPE